MKNIKFSKKIYQLLAIGSTIILLTTSCSNKENNTNVTTETIENNQKDAKKTNFDNFESEKNQINNLIYNENFEKANEFWGKYFIIAIDMIFYNKEYKGINWNTITNEAKKQCIDNLIIIDQSITTIYPDYKEDLEKTKNFAASIYLEGLKKIKETIGKDKYDQIKNSIINNVKDKSLTIKDNILDEADKVYQNYKNSYIK